MDSEAPECFCGYWSRRSLQKSMRSSIVAKLDSVSALRVATSARGCLTWASSVVMRSLVDAIAVSS